MLDMMLGSGYPASNIQHLASSSPVYVSQHNINAADDADEIG